MNRTCVGNDYIDTEQLRAVPCGAAHHTALVVLNGSGAGGGGHSHAPSVCRPVPTCMVVDAVTPPATDPVTVLPADTVDYRTSSDAGTAVSSYAGLLDTAVLVTGDAFMVWLDIRTSRYRRLCLTGFRRSMPIA